MNQCVPSWGRDGNSALRKLNFPDNSNLSNSLPLDVPSLDYEVAELTWKNGQLALNGLGPPRLINKPTGKSSPTKYTTWDKPRAGGTLESIVNQATQQPNSKSAPYGGTDGVQEVVPWFDHYRPMVNTSPCIAMTMDALVPCNNSQEKSTQVLEPIPGVGTCGVSSSGAATALDGGVRGGPVPCGGTRSCTQTNASVCESATFGGRDSVQVTLDTCDVELGAGMTSKSNSLWSPENTSSGKEYTRISGEDHDSVCHSRSQRETGDEEGKSKSNGKSSVRAKRSRAAAIHNQSERKRRDKINQRMKTLQKLVPNSSKTDKASMLDEVIEYLKQLQAQVQLMSRMNMPSMMLPLALQQQFQMSMMAHPAAMAMGMGVMDINAIGRAAASMPPVMQPAAAFMPMASWDMQGDRLPPPPMMPDLLSAFLACQSQSQPMGLDAYNRLAALYQQFQQPSAAAASASASKN